MKIASFLEEVNFNENKPAVSLLLDTDFSKEIRIVFKKGQIMKDHQAPFAIIVQVLKGCIDFGLEGEIKQLNTGDLISLEPKIIHNLTAVEESVVRLTLSKLDTIKRVKNI
ncbi:AraC family ligand binding domain-containing protein [Tenacibaculum bernardetii]|uniref:AraC family ligand binding domain-containing protein n=1 Tax=Tenacibaculum bernardetii TaxID=3021375 RepID=UPI0023B013B3|nr:AraC family ligand binding domain-containing protein [Tenacibaculum bernardetii]